MFIRANMKVCVKVSNLRKIGYFSLREWMNDEENKYIGRQGRIWITEKDGTKSIYHYSNSKWRNPFKVTKTLSAKQSIEKYGKYLQETGLDNQVMELEGYNLGCFCKDNNDCHADYLIKLIKMKKKRKID